MSTSAFARPSLRLARTLLNEATFANTRAQTAVLRADTITNASTGSNRRSERKKRIGPLLVVLLDAARAYRDPS